MKENRSREKGKKEGGMEEAKGAQSHFSQQYDNVIKIKLTRGLPRRGLALRAEAAEGNCEGKDNIGLEDDRSR